MGETRRSERPPSVVVALGVVSLLMDVSSEMIHGTLPLFLTTVLGAGALSVGLIEGVAEATASIVKVFAGAASDRLHRRKPLVALGYGLSALTKPLFPLATSVWLVFGARFADRVGKGIRGAPRDAMVADATVDGARGAAYGLRQALDTVGAFLGPALALVVMAASGDDFRLVFSIAVVPAVASVAVLVLAVREPAITHPGRGTSSGRGPIRAADIRGLEARYWLVVAFATAVTLARFSEAFLLLRAETVGLERAYAPLVLIVMNASYAATAYPLGRLSDRPRRSVLAGGVAVLVGSDLALAFGDRVPWVLAGSALWGVHMGATQGLLSAIVADV